MAGAVALCGLLLLVPGAALAATAPIVTDGPAISGTAQAGAVLTASAKWTGDPPPTVTWEWLRCAKVTGSCAVINGATSTSYVVTASDADSALRARIKLSNTAGADQKRSKPTAVVVPAPAPTPTPTPSPAPPTPTPTATPTPTPTPALGFSVEPVAAPPSAGGVQQQSAARLPMLKPFPVVRIKGALTARGARVTLLSVRAPRGARITVVCRGRNCPVRRVVPAAGGVRRLRPFERELRAGTRLELTVTKPGYIGKYTVIVIRRSAPPRRSDRCLEPEARRAVRCRAA